MPIAVDAHQKRWVPIYRRSTALRLIELGGIDSRSQVSSKLQSRLLGYICRLHFDIKDGKVWIQHNGTEVDVEAELVKLGVPKTAIVIGFHSPFKRQFTDYAVG